MKKPIALEGVCGEAIIDFNEIMAMAVEYEDPIGMSDRTVTRVMLKHGEAWVRVKEFPSEIIKIAERDWGRAYSGE